MKIWRIIKEESVVGSNRSPYESIGGPPTQLIEVVSLTDYETLREELRLLSHPAYVTRPGSVRIAQIYRDSAS